MLGGLFFSVTCQELLWWRLSSLGKVVQSTRPESQHGVLLDALVCLADYYAFQCVFGIYIGVCLLESDRRK